MDHLCPHMDWLPCIISVSYRTNNVCFLPLSHWYSNRHAAGILSEVFHQRSAWCSQRQWRWWWWRGVAPHHLSPPRSARRANYGHVQPGGSLSQSHLSLSWCRTDLSTGNRWTDVRVSNNRHHSIVLPVCNGIANL